MSNLIDGRAIAAAVHAETATRVGILRSRGIQPGLAFIRVGEDPASQVYVGMKEKRAAELGIRSATTVLPAGKTPESWVRNLALAVITGPTTYQPEYNTADIANACKKYGLDAAKILASANENDVATKAARKKPAKAKSAAKKAARK